MSDNPPRLNGITPRVAEIDAMITTIDNPYSPFTQYEEWLFYDLPRYDTCGLLARFTFNNEEFNDEATLVAMQEIATHDPRGIYIVVTEEQQQRLKSVA